MNHRHIALIHDASGEPVILDQGLYFQRISVLEAWAPIVATLLSILLLISSMLFGPISLALYFRKRRTLQILVLCILPAVAALFLLSVISVGSQVMELMKAALPMDNAFTTWTLAKWGFLTTSLAIVVLLGLNWKQLPSKTQRTYLTALALATCYLALKFLTNHWY